MWNPHLNKDINALESVQRFATKVNMTSCNSSYQHRLDKLHCHTLLKKNIPQAVSLVQIKLVYDLSIFLILLPQGEKISRVYKFRNREIYLPVRIRPRAITPTIFRYPRIVEKINRLLISLEERARQWFHFSEQQQRKDRVYCSVLSDTEGFLQWQLSIYLYTRDIPTRKKVLRTRNNDRPLQQSSIMCYL